MNKNVKFIILCFPGSVTNISDIGMIIKSGPFAKESFHIKGVWCTLKKSFNTVCLYQLSTITSGKS